MLRKNSENEPLKESTAIAAAGFGAEMLPGSMGTPLAGDEVWSHHVGSAGTGEGVAEGSRTDAVADGEGVGCQHVEDAAATEPPARATAAVHPAGIRIAEPSISPAMGSEMLLIPTQPHSHPWCLATGRQRSEKVSTIDRMGVGPLVFGGADGCRSGALAFVS